MSYLDTCGIMMLTNRKDMLRRDYNLGSKPADSLVNKNNAGFCIPMPAFGEAMCKIRDKSQDRLQDIMAEFDRLLNKGFFRIRYINNPYATFGLAKKLSRAEEDPRDIISPMDALIIASAASEQDCGLFYTADTKILDVGVAETINDWRDSQGWDRIVFKDIYDVLRS